MTFDFRAARLTMVEGQVRTSDVTDRALVDAMRAVPREALCPPQTAALAYAEAEIEYAPGRFLMRPREIGKLLQAARPQPGERALAIAAPYAAAVLEALGLTVERLDKANLAKAPAKGFDVIVSEGAVAEPPASWLAALGPGGRLAVVVRAGPVGRARLYAHEARGTAMRDLFDSTPPYLPGLEPKVQFAL